MEIKDMILRLENVTKKYGSFVALNAANLDLETGIYGLVGKNGAGKTTLMKLLVDLLKPSSGSVTFNGKDISKLGKQYRELLGYLPQDFNCNPQITVTEFLTYVGALKGLTKQKLSTVIEEVLTAVTLWDKRNEKIKSLSGGMLRRLGIAQALLNDPKILILDEPTVGLDPIENIKIRNMVSALASSRIVLVSSHIMSDISSISNKIIIMKEGSILANADEASILNSVHFTVWEVSAKPAELSRLANKAIIINQVPKDGYVHVRYISNEPLVAQSVKSPVTLEDAFTWMMLSENERLPYA